jgi:hypothetical protein
LSILLLASPLSFPPQNLPIFRRISSCASPRAFFRSPEGHLESSVRDTNPLCHNLGRFATLGQICPRGACQHPSFS